MADYFNTRKFRLSLLCDETHRGKLLSRRIVLRLTIGSPSSRIGPSNRFSVKSGSVGTYFIGDIAVAV
jgi:hypothetical protein